MRLPSLTGLPPWRRTLYALWGAQFLALMGMSLIMPFIPFYIRDLGVQGIKAVAIWSGVLFAAPFLVSAFMTPVWGLMGDRYGRRIMVVRAVAGIVVVTFLMGLARSVHEFLFLRLAQGAITGFVAASLALMASEAPPEEMGYALGILQTSVTSGSIVGPLLGGILADLLGYRHVFFVTAGLGVVATLMVLWGVREERGPSERREGPTLRENWIYVLTSPALRAIYLTMFLVQFALQIVEPIMSLYVEHLGISPRYLATAAGAVFAVTGLANILVAPRWGRRSDRQRDFRGTLSLALTGAALLYLPQALVTSPWQLLLLRAALGTCIAGILPTLYAITGRTVPEARRGGVMGVTQSALLLGAVAGPLSGGFLAATLGLRWIFVLTAILLFTSRRLAARIVEPAPWPARKPASVSVPGPA